MRRVGHGQRPDPQPVRLEGGHPRLRPERRPGPADAGDEFGAGVGDEPAADRIGGNRRPAAVEHDPVPAGRCIAADDEQPGGAEPWRVHRPDAEQRHGHTHRAALGSP
jgi:hypothetical protein